MITFSLAATFILGLGISGASALDREAKISLAAPWREGLETGQTNVVGKMYYTREHGEGYGFGSGRLGIRTPSPEEPRIHPAVHQEPGGWHPASDRGPHTLQFDQRSDQNYAQRLGLIPDQESKPERKHPYRAGAFLGGLIAVVSLWALSLRRLVRVRTKDLREANARLIRSQEDLHHVNAELVATVQELSTTADELSRQYQELQKMESRLLREKDLLRITLLSVGDGVVVTNSEGTITMINRTGERLLGFHRGSAAGQRFCRLFPKKECAFLKKVISGEKAIRIDGMELVSKEGSRLIAAGNISPIRDVQGELRGAVVVFRDISEAVRQRTEIEFLSFRDHLTGAYNRRGFSREMSRLDQENFLPLSIIVADLNGLKFINDAFGHAVGDQFLIRASHILEKSVPERGIVARLGGDEFAVMLPNTAGEQARQLLREIRGLAKKEAVRSKQISLALGAAVKERPEQNIQTVYNTAEKAMYTDKISAGPGKRAVDLLVSILFADNPGEKEHAHRVAELGKMTALALQLPSEQIEELYTVGLLHDIGKIAVDTTILRKGPLLNRREEAELKRHPEWGYRILRGCRDMEAIAAGILAHHERFDGKGFPRGLKGTEIPFYARIIAIADTYDNIAQERGLSGPQEASKKLREEAGTRFDPDLVQVFVEKVLPQLHKEREH
ncbi:MAG: diguanylate cyclase [Firmicutes bacterium]|nr:diguanylate cyclase [Bacillota bacterium]